MARCLVISAPASGTGKTTLTLALARAYRERLQRLHGAVDLRFPGVGDNQDLLHVP